MKCDAHQFLGLIITNREAKSVIIPYFPNPYRVDFTNPVNLLCRFGIY